MNPIQSLIKDLADQHGRHRENLLPVMQGVVQKEKFLSEYSMIEIAREMDIPLPKYSERPHSIRSLKRNLRVNTLSVFVKQLPVP
jgi:hypothetical protein